MAGQLQLFKTAGEVSDFVGKHRKSGKSIGFVPTMGALHNGHLSLIKSACEENGIVICSIFINPTQFTNPEDLSNYPRDIEGDILKLKGTDCSALFYPENGEVYPQENPEIHDLGYLDLVMESKFRPGHFQGVSQVVKRLFEIVQPDNAYFGLKDYQQFLVVKRLVSNSDLDVNIVGCETMREADGLAMSSRNLLLNASERELASLFFKGLNIAKEHVLSKRLLDIKLMVRELFENAPGCKLEYFEIAEANTLRSLTMIPPHVSVIACIAGYVGKVRLIDNLILIP